MWVDLVSLSTMTQWRFSLMLLELTLLWNLSKWSPISMREFSSVLITNRSLMRCLNSLTSKALTHILNCVSFRVTTPEGLFHIFIHFCSPWVDGIQCIVGFKHYPFFQLHPLGIRIRFWNLVTPYLSSTKSNTSLLLILALMLSISWSLTSACLISSKWIGWISMFTRK